MLTLSTVSTSGRESEVTDSPPLAMAAGLTAFTMARDQLSLTELESLSIPVWPPASGGQPPSDILPFTTARDLRKLTELVLLSTPSE